MFLSTESPSIAELSTDNAVVNCYHCGLSVPRGQEFTLVIEQQTREFCCPGCQAVATAIHEGGLDQFYQYRSELNHKIEDTDHHFTLYDRDDVQQSFVDKHENGEKTARLLLDGITCAACVWLIEKRLQSMVGVQQVRVNAASHQCQLRWQVETTSLSQIMAVLASIGYPPKPLSNDHQQQQRKQQQRLALMRLGVAAFGMMQVGMVAAALYAGTLQGMDEQWRHLLRWLSLIVATPVVLFSAQPFWAAAWRSLKQHHLTMEVPVSLAILLAYGASVWATLTNTGEVYFDSVSMFTFFLLLGRYLEMRARYRNHQQTANFTRLLPVTVLRVDERNQVERILLEELVVGDRVRINTGDTIPCDGIVLEGSSAVIEALLTGESAPITKHCGDRVIAGTLNSDGSLLIQATAVEQQTRLSTIEKLVAFAQQDKPKIQVIADRVASYFVAAILLIAVSVFIFWSYREPESALWITLSVLVVTCPCALSLATPTVLTATMERMRKEGLLVLAGHVIETLSRIEHIVFDKTGTLTYGEPQVRKVVLLKPGMCEEDVLAIAAALEEGSSHPIANAFADYRGRYSVSDLQIVIGAGVTGVVTVADSPSQVSAQYCLGKVGFATTQVIEPPTPGQWLLLSESSVPLAWIQLADQLRDSADTAISLLQQQNIAIHILSGDSETVVATMSDQLGGVDYLADMSPEQKLKAIQQWQQSKRVLMVGDGINDVPVLAGADVSIAMDSASDLARTHADTILLNGNLCTLPQVIHLAHRCRSIIRQNITWALLYNMLALPLAAAGLIPPYIAALGMSLSSLVVVFNALRV